MSKIALLIGVSEYKSGLTPLPSALEDIKVMHRMLSDPTIGGFKTVGVLSNPDPLSIQIELKAVSALSRDKNDLIFLFFSGHIFKDDRENLYLGTTLSSQPQRRERLQTTTVPLSFIDNLLKQCNSRRQIIVLDACLNDAFLAFAEQKLMKEIQLPDLRTQIGGEGRAILTADTSGKYGVEQKQNQLSLYTRYLIEGLETGMADRDRDQMIAVEEWHEYAQQKVQETLPTINPKIYAIKESYKILVAKVSSDNPKQLYRQEVERLAQGGEFVPETRLILDQQRQRLKINSQDAQSIEQTILKSYREYQKSLQRYEENFSQMTGKDGSVNEKTRSNLKQLQQVLGIKSKDVEVIETRVITAKTQTVVDSEPLPTVSTPIPLNPDFIALCKQELSNYAGPMANMMVQGALSSQPNCSCQELIEAIARKIKNSKQATAFRKALLLSLAGK